MTNGPGREACEEHSRNWREQIAVTVVTHEPSTDRPVRQGIATRLLMPGFGAALSIITMWLAVLFDGIFGGDMAFTSSPTNVTTMPSAVAMALFAVIGMSAVAKGADSMRSSRPVRR